MKHYSKQTAFAQLIGTVVILASILSRPPDAYAQNSKNSAPARPGQVLSGFRFTSGDNALNIPFELYGNTILLKVRINKSEPLSFMFDTGAGASVLNASRAKTLGLKGQTKVDAKGMGGSVEGTLIEGATIEFPGVEVFDQRIAALPLDALAPNFGRPIDGIIGYDFIKQFVIEIDYLAKIINLYTPQTYRYSSSSEVIPFVIRGGSPYAQVKIQLQGHQPIAGVFEVDTASDGTLSVNKPFVERQKLRELLPATNKEKGAGVGGETSYVNSRVKAIQIGRFSLENPIVSISEDTEGEGASTKSDGQLGTEVFRRFKVILDYSRKQMVLEPNKSLSEPFELDMSGLDIIAGGEDFRTFTLESVKPNSPAAEADLREGDVIVAIDGHPAKEYNLDQLSLMFMKENKEYELSVRRGTEIINKKIKLRRLI
jgi:hypothetical protein